MLKKLVSVFSLLVFGFLLIPGGISAKADVWDDGISPVCTVEPCTKFKRFDRLERLPGLQLTDQERLEILLKLGCAAESIEKSVCKLPRATSKDRDFADYLSQYARVLYELMTDVDSGQLDPKDVQAEMPRRLRALPVVRRWRAKKVGDFPSRCKFINYYTIKIRIFDSGVGIYEYEEGAPRCGWTRLVVDTFGKDWRINERPTAH